MNTAFSNNAESKTVGENFLVQMAPAINRQVSVQVEWLESQRKSRRGISRIPRKDARPLPASVRGVNV